ncbi:hypothetical protein A9Q96_15210 [Rhodobacterales bacterium 52_120_T64]|nr:hypothetical protein A9Q96_15210 [Rhodobacterales bacterium 52_120_T64]
MQNNILNTLAYFTTLDFAALGAILFAWGIMGWFIERHRPNSPSTHALIAEYRFRWMEVMLTRDVRMVDANILTSLRQGASFFTSASMIAIGGGIAMLGKADRLQGVAADLSGDVAPIVVWEAKILLVVLILASAFLKFVWSHRLFGYCAVVMAAVPEGDANDPEAIRMARKAAKLNIYASRSFNRGIRTMYFALAGMAWLLGPVALLLATAATVLMLYRREFHSQSRVALLED